MLDWPDRKSGNYRLTTLANDETVCKKDGGLKGYSIST